MADDVQVVFTRRRPKPEVGGFQFDLALDERHTFESTVTTYPVEKGSNISDNISLQPYRLTLTGFVTNAPLVLISNQDGKFLTADEGKTRIDTMLDALLSLRKNKSPITVVTGLIRYDNMVIASMSVPRNAAMGDSLSITLDLIEIRQVSTSRVAYESLALNTTGPKANTDKRGSTNKDLGTQNTVPVDDATKAKYDGILGSLVIR